MSRYDKSEVDVQVLIRKYFAYRGKFFVRLCLPFTFALALFCLSSAHAETDFSWRFKEPLRKELEEILAGTSDKTKPYIENKCRNVITDYLWTEQGKVEFNHLFHEIDSEEQQQDVKLLAENMAKTKSCKRHIKLWLEYDDKWYAPKPNLKKDKTNCSSDCRILAPMYGTV